MMEDNLKLFVDLDGVLADFDEGVKRLMGSYPWELSVEWMWEALAESPEFFATLPMMADAEEIWSFCKSYEVAILTGLPHGTWAREQKREWVREHLGEDVEFFACASRDKYQWSKSGCILIDDRESHRGRWEKWGGIFIHHKDAATTIEQLKKLGS